MRRPQRSIHTWRILSPHLNRFVAPAERGPHAVATTGRGMQTGGGSTGAVVMDEVRVVDLLAQLFVDKNMDQDGRR